MQDEAEYVALHHVEQPDSEAIAPTILPDAPRKAVVVLQSNILVLDQEAEDKAPANRTPQVRCHDQCPVLEPDVHQDPPDRYSMSDYVECDLLPLAISVYINVPACKASSCRYTFQHDALRSSSGDHRCFRYCL